MVIKVFHVQIHTNTRDTDNNYRTHRTNFHCIEIVQKYKANYIEVSSDHRVIDKLAN